MRASGSATERLFLAVPLTEQARSEIVARLPTLPTLPTLPGRLVPPQNWHFTLRFLGDTDQAIREVVIASMRAARLGREFSICFRGLGAFPRSNRARILWLGVVDGAARLLSLAGTVEAAVRSAGLAPEARPFKPHLTLSRIEPTRSVADVLAAQQAWDVVMPVREVDLVRSSLGTGPARYEVVERFPLEMSRK